jgi:hypothetical protein
MYKLLMSWDLLPEKHPEYIEFLTKELAPALVDLGIRPTEVWYAIYGGSPQVRAGGVAEDLETLEQILLSNEWRELEKKLRSYVTHFRRKIVVASSGFQM